MNPDFTQWFSLPADRAMDAPATAIGAYREALQQGHAELRKRFSAGADAAQLVAALSWLVDQLLSRAWCAKIDHQQQLSLVAVGGYGRSELLPGSDIDLMILLPEGSNDADHAADLQDFLTFLWDIGLEVGHSVRTPKECAEQALQDVTVITNLVEARHLCGNQQLFDRMRDAVEPERLWDCREFFAAKLTEQQARHAKYHDTGYKLEPNIKESPGGLRDIHMIGWVAKRHFGAERLVELVRHDFLTQEEYDALAAGQHFLWRLRFALHFHTGRREDRLLFDYQRPMAEQLGYEDSAHQQAVEHFMGDYFRNVQELNRLNDVLLQLFREAILHADDPADPVPINKRFQKRKGFLEASHEGVFEHQPFALLELFLLLQQHPELEGVRASTIRLIRGQLHLIDAEFREDLRCRSLFLAIFREPLGLTHVLRKMNSYGVLAAYLPVFANIVGQMQFDLFHTYTVDEHTLFLVRNLRRFTVSDFADEFPLCSRVSKTIAKPELLYLAGLFHDIAKGRGGDHSELGAEDAYVFCIHHCLSEYDAKLVSWLVRNHLIMSSTAQRKDISDPAVIHDFATHIGDPAHLDYLYLLTVADIRATNPEMWNSWKDSLLQDLYKATKHALRHGLADALDQDERADSARRSALELLQAEGIAAAAVTPLWAQLDRDYFLRHRPDEIVWQAQSILGLAADQQPTVNLRTQAGGTELFLYTPVRDHLFSHTTAVLDQLGLSVADARIISSRNQHALNTYVLLEQDGEPIQGEFRIEEIRTTLLRKLQAPSEQTPRVTRRSPRQHQHFPIPTRIAFSQDEANGRTVVDIITTDRPGLLSLIGQTFDDTDISLENARIATFGTRAEDVFYIVNRAGEVLDKAQQEKLKDNLLRELGATAAGAGP